jgi:DNA-binding response OmpR family regulator
MRLLIVEDDPTLAEFLHRVLEEEGFVAELAVDAASGIRRAAAESYDVIVLDWMLPDGDGPSFCTALRNAGNYTPVLMLTARSEVHDRILGLRAGADDYLGKPFDVEELLARLDALVRRSEQLAQLVVGELVLDRLHRRCLLGGVPLDLTAREYDFVLRLAVANEAPVARAVLLTDVWLTSNDPGSGVLDVHVSRLRDKLGAEAWRVETVRGIGYRLRSRR